MKWVTRSFESNVQEYELKELGLLRLAKIVHIADVSAVWVSPGPNDVLEP